MSGSGELVAAELPWPDEQSGHAWVVVHTRPRCEKKLAEAARRQTILTYLPVHRRTHQYGVRERTFTSPMFPGYLFAYPHVVGRRWLMQNRHAANLLEVSDQRQLVEQLRQLHTALQSGHLMEVLPYLESGRRVRVLAGPLRGLEGMIVRVKGQTRMVLNVDMIRESVSVEVDSSMLSPV